MTSNTDKLHLIVHSFFTKLAHVIAGLRPEPLLPPRLNRWFNLDLTDLSSRSALRDALRGWRPLALAPGAPIAPLVVETVLDLALLAPEQQVLLAGVVVAKGGRKREIVLERWLVELDPTDPATDTPLPTVYKLCIVHFRCLYAYVRLLPAYSLAQRLRGCDVHVGCRILDGNAPITSRGRIGLSKALGNEGEGHVVRHRFQPVSTPAGTLRVAVSYRRDCRFVTPAESRRASADSGLLAASPLMRIRSEPPRLSGSSTTQPIRVQRPLVSTTSLLRRFSLTSNALMSVSPSTPALQGLRRVNIFRSGLPPPQIHRSLLSILVAALLRNPKPFQPAELPTLLMLPEPGLALRFSLSFGRRHGLALLAARRRSSVFGEQLPEPEPGLGLYVDDDIGLFVKMIDAKTSLRLGEGGAGAELSRFREMRSHYNEISDALGESLREVGEGTGRAARARPLGVSQVQLEHAQRQRYSDVFEDDDDEGLLFEMSDLNLGSGKG